MLAPIAGFQSRNIPWTCRLLECFNSKSTLSEHELLLFSNLGVFRNVQFVLNENSQSVHLTDALRFWFCNWTIPRNILNKYTQCFQTTRTTRRISVQFFPLSPALLARGLYWSTTLSNRTSSWKWMFEVFKIRFYFSYKQRSRVMMFLGWSLRNQGLFNFLLHHPQVSRALLAACRWLQGIVSPSQVSSHMNMQWWDRQRITTIDVPIQEGKKTGKHITVPYP